MNVTALLKGKIVLFIVSAKMREREESISTHGFYGQFPYY